MFPPVGLTWVSLKELSTQIYLPKSQKEVKIASIRFCLTKRVIYRIQNKFMSDSFLKTINQQTKTYHAFFIVWRYIIKNKERMHILDNSQYSDSS